MNIAPEITKEFNVTPDIKSQTMDVDSAAAEALEQENNRPQDSFYDSAAAASRSIGLEGSKEGGKAVNGHLRVGGMS